MVGPCLKQNIVPPSASRYVHDISPPGPRGCSGCHTNFTRAPLTGGRRPRGHAERSLCPPTCVSFHPSRPTCLANGLQLTGLDLFTQPASAGRHECLAHHSGPLAKLSCWLFTRRHFARLLVICSFAGVLRHARRLHQKPSQASPGLPSIKPTPSAACNQSSLSRGSTAAPASECRRVDYYRPSDIGHDATSWTQSSRLNFSDGRIESFMIRKMQSSAICTTRGRPSSFRWGLAEDYARGS